MHQLGAVTGLLRGKARQYRMLPWFQPILDDRMKVQK